MSGNFVSNPCRVVASHLTTTANVTVHTATGYTQLIDVHLSNITTSAVVCDVRYFSDSANDSYSLLTDYSVPANRLVTLPLQGFALNEDDEIRVQANTATAIDVMLTISEVPGRSG